MIAELNLAREPFRNRTLPWAVAITVAFASLIALVFIVEATRRTAVQAEASERDLSGLNQQVEQLRAAAEAVRESLPPDDKRVLDAAHALVDRRRFSWSRLFADLEASLPAGVRVTRIAVRDASHRGQQIYAELGLTVVGRTPGDGTEMISDMNRTGVFFVEPVTETMRTGRNNSESGVEWTLRVRYSPPPGGMSPAQPSTESAPSSVAAVAP